MSRRRNEAISARRGGGRWLAIGLFTLVVGVLAACQRGPSEPVFVELDSPLSGSKLNDLGAVDADGDGVLDLFTTNHEYAARLLLGDGRGGFRDVTDDRTLGIAPRLPGLEAARLVRRARRQGLHIFFLRNELIFDVDTPLGVSARVGARVEFPSQVEWVAEGGLVVTGSGGARQGSGVVVDLVCDGDGRLRILPLVPDHGITVRIAPDTPLSKVAIGSVAVPTGARDFELRQIDRHGMAWADFDEDGDVDVFIARGGRLGTISDTANDELLVNRGGRYGDVANAVGIRKRRGRGRRVAWVDYDGDGRLDLYVGNLATPNQLYAQAPEGRFTEVGAVLGLDMKDGDVFRWLDFDGDSDADLLVAGRGGEAAVWVNDGGSFSRRAVAGSTTAEPLHMAPADFDRDGDVDVLIVDAETSVVLLADDGSFVARSPASFGLPRSSLTANWVDFDNDGLVDLHALPRGMFRQGASGRFEHVGMRLPDLPVRARCTWLDVDGDGDRDGVCELAQRLQVIEHEWYRNDTDGGNWLALDLVGGASRRPQLGTEVVATIDGRRQAHVVGEAEGSHFSQGHTRIYLGLGGSREVDRLDITWPDGRLQVAESVAANQVLTIERRVAP